MGFSWELIFLMGIEKLEEYIPEKETLNTPLGIPFTKSMAERYHKINRELYTFDKRLSLHEFSRRKINEMMDEVERLLAEQTGQTAK